MSDHHVEVMDEREPKGVLEFAEFVLENKARAWAEFTVDQRQRFQNVVFPEGLDFDRETGFGTCVTTPHPQVFARDLDWRIKDGSSGRI